MTYIRANQNTTLTLNYDRNQLVENVLSFTKENQRSNQSFFSLLLSGSK